MSTAAIVTPPLRLTDAETARLRMCGLDPVAAELGSDAGVEGGDDGGGEVGEQAGAVPLVSPAGAIEAAAGRDGVIVTGRGGDDALWRREAVSLLSRSTAAAASGVASAPLVLVLLPARVAPRSGPVAVLSPPDAASSYEIIVGAALASACGRRVEHINSRGLAGSVVQSTVAARAALRAEVVEWRKQADPRPVKALRELSSRPSLIVLPVPPGSADAGAVVADHPDADVVLVFDAVHAAHGRGLAQQIYSMVELALGVEVELARASSDSAHGANGANGANVPDSTERAESPLGADPVNGAGGDPTPLRASDVVHVRLTDSDLEITNRTRQRVKVRVGLGSKREPDRVLAVFEGAVEPGQTHAEPTAAVAAIDQLDPPRPVLRHWSHSSSEVYEGGERRIVEVELSLAEVPGQGRAAGRFTAPNGLDFSVTARELAALSGRTDASAVLPEPVPPVDRASGVDLLEALWSALGVGSGLLARALR